MDQAMECIKINMSSSFGKDIHCFSQISGKQEYFENLINLFL